MLSSRQAWFLLNKPQFSALHVVTFSGLLTLIILNLHGSYDPTACAKLLQEDLKILCRMHYADLGLPAEAGEFLKAAAPPQPKAIMPASMPSDPEIILPRECFAPAPKSPPYASDIIMRPMADIGKLTVVPGVNEWGILMANSTVQVNGKVLTFDDVLYAYDIMFENLALFSHTMWFGVSVQQDPTDAFQLSSLLWREQPDLLIEIGTNTGGGAIFYANVMREYNPDSLVLTIDPKDPAKDWAAGVQGCPACKDVRCTKIWHSKNVKFIHGFSSEPKVVAQVEQIVKGFKKVVVMHDGSHFYDDVLKDLETYDRFTPVGSYMVVQDTKMTRMYSKLFKNKYPLGAVEAFMKGQGRARYVIDKQYEFLLYSQHHNGWLRKLRP